MDWVLPYTLVASLVQVLWFLPWAWQRDRHLYDCLLGSYCLNLWCCPSQYQLLRFVRHVGGCADQMGQIDQIAWCLRVCNVIARPLADLARLPHSVLR